MTGNNDSSKNPTKVEDKAAASEEEVLLSLDDLDAAINQEDPGFAQGLGGIGPNEEMQNSVAGDGFDLEYTLSDEETLWKHSGGLRSLIYKIFPFSPRLSFNLRKLKLKIRERIIHYKVVLIGAGPSLAKWSKTKLKNLKSGFSESLRSFKYFSLQKKLGTFGLIALVILSGFVVYRSLTKGLFPPPQELFVGSLKEWSQEAYTYEPEKEMETFYDSTHSSQNMIVVPKMVVNLKRSANSGENPMGAFDFYVEGTASDVVVEVKDREAEVQDLFQRTIEDMNYDQVASGEGKQLLCEKLRKEVNRILTRGKVRRVFIKTAIIKP